MLIDTRFLSLHPATAHWFERRERCQACAHMRRIAVRGEEVVRCAVALTPDLRVRAAGRARGTHHDYMYCIDASADGGPCGAGSRLFEEKT